MCSWAVCATLIVPGPELVALAPAREERQVAGVAHDGRVPARRRGAGLVARQLDRERRRRRPGAASAWIAALSGPVGSTVRIRICALASGASTFGATPPSMSPTLSVEGPSSGSRGQRHPPDALDGVEQHRDGALPFIGIGRVGRAARRRQVHAERALLADRQAVLGRLAVDQEAPARLQAGRRAGAVGAVLLADQEQQPDPPLAARGQPLRRRDHRGGEALGVAAPAAMDRVRVLGQREIRRHAVHVGGEHQRRRLAEGEQVVAPGRHRLPHRAVARPAKRAVEQVGGRPLRPGRGLEGHQRAREPEGVGQCVHECKVPRRRGARQGSRLKRGGSAPGQVLLIQGAS